MNVLLTTHPPQPTAEYTARRVGTFDRIALHLGLALIKWGRRTHRVGRREKRLALVAQDQRWAEYLSRRAREQRNAR